jgi:HEPN domain-containing protein
VNRDDFKELAQIRLREAKTLIDNGHFDGAYYLCGYVVECGLKACIAKQTKRFDFPDKKTATDSHTHDLTKLVGLANLQVMLDNEMSSDTAFANNWTTVKDWKETSRYEIHNPQNAIDIFEAIIDKRHGVLRWLKRHW